jgi:hypothetical protein
MVGKIKLYFTSELLLLTASPHGAAANLYAGDVAQPLWLGNALKLEMAGALPHSYFGRLLRARSPKDGCDLLTGCRRSVLLGMTMRNFRLFAIHRWAGNPPIPWCGLRGTSPGETGRRGVKEHKSYLPVLRAEHAPGTERSQGRQGAGFDQMRPHCLKSKRRRRNEPAPSALPPPISAAAPTAIRDAAPSSN